MERWTSKVAVVTGAGRGIGFQIAESLVAVGMTVIAFEPTDEKIYEMMLNSKNWETTNGRLIPCKCDISQDEELVQAFNGTVTTYGGVDLLINNAAIGIDGLICNGDIKAFKDIIDVNIYGLLASTRLAIASMVEKGCGQVINVNSICGHYMPNFLEPKVNMYIASKKAMTAFNEAIIEECKLHKRNIKVTSVSPGMVNTEIFKTAGISFIDDKFFSENPHLTTKDVSSVILKVLALPKTVHVKEIIFQALNEN